MVIDWATSREEHAIAHRRWLRKPYGTGRTPETNGRRLLRLGRESKAAKLSGVTASMFGPRTHSDRLHTHYWVERVNLSIPHPEFLRACGLKVGRASVIYQKRHRRALARISNDPLRMTLPERRSMFPWMERWLAMRNLATKHGLPWDVPWPGYKVLRTTNSLTGKAYGGIADSTPADRKEAFRREIGHARGWQSYKAMSSTRHTRVTATDAGPYSTRCRYHRIVRRMRVQKYFVFHRRTLVLRFCDTDYVVTLPKGWTWKPCYRSHNLEPGVYCGKTLLYTPHPWSDFDVTKIVRTLRNRAMNRLTA